MIPWLEPADPFPPVDRAMRDPNGLLAAGGDLSPQRLLDAYMRGIFPWFGEDDPLLWWSPDPRMVLFLD
jgi:leucyl/phenylalanyl-tRNA--protein transferase